MRYINQLFTYLLTYLLTITKMLHGHFTESDGHIRDGMVILRRAMQRLSSSPP